MNRADTALSCFADCFNCSQAVLSAYAGHLGARRPECPTACVGFRRRSISAWDVRLSPATKRAFVPGAS